MHRGVGDTVRKLHEVFFRAELLNVSSLVSTSVVFAAVMHLGGFRVDLSVESSSVRRQQGTCAIKFFHTTNVPPIRQTDLMPDLYSLYRMMCGLFPSSTLGNPLGRWRTFRHSSRMMPGGGQGSLVASYRRSVGIGPLAAPDRLPACALREWTLRGGRHGHDGRRGAGSGGHPWCPIGTRRLPEARQMSMGHWRLHYLL